MDISNELIEELDEIVHAITLLDSDEPVKIFYNSTPIGIYMFAANYEIDSEDTVIYQGRAGKFDYQECLEKLELI